MKKNYALDFQLFIARTDTLVWRHTLWRHVVAFIFAWIVQIRLLY